MVKNTAPSAIHSISRVGGGLGAPPIWTDLTRTAFIGPVGRPTILSLAPMRCGAVASTGVTPYRSVLPDSQFRWGVEKTKDRQGTEGTPGALLKPKVANFARTHKRSGFRGIARGRGRFLGFGSTLYKKWWTRARGAVASAACLRFSSRRRLPETSTGPLLVVHGLPRGMEARLELTNVYLAGVWHGPQRLAVHTGRRRGRWDGLAHSIEQLRKGRRRHREPAMYRSQLPFEKVASDAAMISGA